MSNPALEEIGRLRDWRPGESALPRDMPIEEWGIYSAKYYMCRQREVVQAADRIIYRMMGRADADRE